MKTVLENNLIGDQFFLTRQTANLIEDFVREINKSSSLFLLYGAGSVGKSRLLQELTTRDFEQRKFCWLDLKLDRVDSETTEKSEDSQQQDFATEIHELMEVADEHDVIIVDHFEFASNKAKHQLFQSWTTDGIDKNINIIIAAATGSFNEVRQLAQQYKIKIKSFQLMPCSMDEIEAFLSFYLFPANPLNSLSIPTEIRKQLRNSGGKIGKVIEVAEQQGKQVTIKPESDSESKNYAAIAAGSLLLFLVVIGIAYQYWQPAITDDLISESRSEKTITIVSDNDDVVSIKQQSTTHSNSNTEILQSTSDLDVTVPEQEIADTPGSKTITIDAGNDLKSENNVSKEELSDVSQPVQLVADSNKTEESEELLAANNDHPFDRYQKDLDHTQEWIIAQDKNRATIQIMTIGSDSFNDGTYHRYLEKLESKNIDVSGIRIYRGIINDSVAYGVIYGSYENRREASKNIEQLPEALKAKQPIPRTIGGIWNEINNQ